MISQVTNANSAKVRVKEIIFIIISVFLYPFTLDFIAFICSLVAFLKTLTDNEMIKGKKWSDPFKS